MGKGEPEPELVMVGLALKRLNAMLPFAQVGREREREAFRSLCGGEILVGWRREVWSWSCGQMRQNMKSGKRATGKIPCITPTLRKLVDWSLEITASLPAQ